MSIHPMKLSLLTAAKYCQLFNLDEDELKKIITIEDIMYKKVVKDYTPKKQSFNPKGSSQSLEIGRNT